MKAIVVYCTKCGGAHLYTKPDPLPMNPKKWCNSCKYQFPVGKYLKTPSKNRKLQKSHDSSIITDKETQGERIIGSSPLTQYTKIDDDMIEELILKKANSGEELSDNFIKTCIQFYKDIRGKDDKIKDNVDMEDLKLIATSLENSS